jgi:hypothetical protein
MTQKGSRRTRAGNRERREGEGFGQPQREAIALMKQLVVEAEAFDRAVNTALQTVILKDDEEKYVPRHHSRTYASTPIAGKAD